MKITTEDYKRLESLILDTVKEYNLQPYNKYGMSKVRYIWDIFHVTIDRMQFNNRVSDYLFMRGLHDYLSDIHIETALKRMLIK